jgi:hypothetical protein
VPAVIVQVFTKVEHLPCRRCGAADVLTLGDGLLCEPCFDRERAATPENALLVLEGLQLDCTQCRETVRGWLA